MRTPNEAGHQGRTLVTWDGLSSPDGSPGCCPCAPSSAAAASSIATEDAAAGVPACCASCSRSTHMSL